MRTIDPKYLIDPDFASVTEQILSKDQVLDIYLHNSAGVTAVSGGLYGPQNIEALAWDDNDIDFAKSFINELDRRLDIDLSLTVDTLIRYQYLSGQILIWEMVNRLLVLQ